MLLPEKGQRLIAGHNEKGAMCTWTVDLKFALKLSLILLTQETKDLSEMATNYTTGIVEIIMDRFYLKRKCRIMKCRYIWRNTILSTWFVSPTTVPTIHIQCRKPHLLIHLEHRTQEQTRYYY